MGFGEGHSFACINKQYDAVGADLWSELVLRTQPQQLLEAPFSLAPGWLGAHEEVACTRSAAGQHLSSWACLAEAQLELLETSLQHKLQWVVPGEGMIIS